MNGDVATVDQRRLRLLPQHSEAGKSFAPSPPRCHAMMSESWLHRVSGLLLPSCYHSTPWAAASVCRRIDAPKMKRAVDWRVGLRKG